MRQRGKRGIGGDVRRLGSRCWLRGRCWSVGGLGRCRFWRVRDGRRCGCRCSRRRGHRGCLRRCGFHSGSGGLIGGTAVRALCRGRVIGCHRGCCDPGFSRRNRRGLRAQLPGDADGKDHRGGDAEYGWPARTRARRAWRLRRGNSIGGRRVHGSACGGQDRRVQRGRWALFGAAAEQARQLAFFRRQRFVSVHAFNPARSLPIA